mmetsp:Transcript_3106/g.7315  ORF Transcript_3106/g.7315 Transcript_3106/m.7315 type:complete len:84 (-) Transcript_3106:163-414(-)
MPRPVRKLGSNIDRSFFACVYDREFQAERLALACLLRALRARATEMGEYLRRLFRCAVVLEPADGAGCGACHARKASQEQHGK